MQTRKQISFSKQAAAKLKVRTVPTFVILMLIFGIVMVADATSVHSSNLYGSPLKFAFLQFVWVAVGLVLYTYFYKTDLYRVKKLAFPLLVISSLSLGILALIRVFDIDTAFSPLINGAHRWLYLNPAPLPKIPFLGVLGFQPSELAKLALILYLGFQLEKSEKVDKEAPFRVYLITTAIISGLILLQPNMSTAAITFLMATSMYFVSGFDLKKLFVLLPVLAVLGLVFVLASPYRRLRLMTLLSNNQAEDQKSSSYHINQVSISLGTGGLFGVGFGQSKQKYQYLPEVASDSIFAIIGEEFGFVGTAIFVAIFAYFIFYGIRLSYKCTELSPKLISIGITSWIALQFFVNVGAMVKLIPLTGVPIPLVSYGGSSMVFTLSALGILANIEKNN